jgi:hypothetical protein
MKFPNIPIDITPSLSRFLRDLSTSLDRELKVRVPNTQPSAALLLASPSGKVYSVQVDDVGALFVTLVNE